ncbi:GNAT family N-acetyltransferase [Geomonas anaerohicana]|uniref:GNAT family N-acetyltransferase n=1 Tax=Geomonas anaerohicana TaxID=2798583 RepID=A0ABS0YCE8_9BACT|nr:GNAT family N-acetyltransferase [Geomonas anaerohicana]MBJ6749804.1 GNAT family N-acetyltransferase [Geomonas anaerohicana]
MSELSVTVIDTPEQLQGLAPQWNELLAASAADGVFLTWEWMSAWLGCCLKEGRELFVLFFSQRERPAGIAPFYRERRKGAFGVRTIRFLGAPEGGSDYLDVICRRGCEEQVAGALYRFLLEEGRGEWDLLHLQDIPADSVFLLRFLERVDEAGRYLELAPGAYCPALELEESREDGWPRRASAGCKKKYEKELALLQREGEVVHLAEEEAGAASLERFFRLYRAVSGRPGTRLISLLQGYLERRGPREGVRIDTLAVQGKEIASLLHFRYRDSLFLYLVAVDKTFNPKVSIGHLLLGKCILDAGQKGYRRYDFLKGGEPYKFHWAAGGRRSLQVRLWRKTPLGLAAGLARMARQAGKLLLR